MVASLHVTTCYMTRCRAHLPPSSCSGTLPLIGDGCGTRRHKTSGVHIRPFGRFQQHCDRVWDASGRRVGFSCGRPARRRTGEADGPCVGEVVCRRRSTVSRRCVCSELGRASINFRITNIWVRLWLCDIAAIIWPPVGVGRSKGPAGNKARREIRPS